MSVHVQNAFEHPIKPIIEGGPRHSFPTRSDVQRDYDKAQWFLKSQSNNGSISPTGIWTNTIYVPYWVKLALVRNNLDTSHLVDVERLQQVLSAADIAKFIRAQYVVDEAVYKDSHTEYVSSAGYGLYSLTMNNPKQDRLFDNLRILSNTAEIKEETISLLSLDDKAIPIDLSKNYHRMELYRDNMILIYVDPGILNALKDRDYSKRFISDYLKAQYTYMPIHEVGNSMMSRGLYYEYLKLL